VLQTTPMHGSALQSPEAASQPKSQCLSVDTIEQLPSAARQEPGWNVREVLESLQVAFPGAHVTAEPPHAPLPSQASDVVQRLPSSQLAPGARGWYEQAPFAGLHVPVAL
jgi:hypothetical protein